MSSVTIYSLKLDVDMAMTQVLSVSAATAAYAMEAAKPARRISTKDQVRDVKNDAETNEIAKTGSAEKAEAVALIPPLALSLGDTMQRNAENFPSLQDVSKAYEETE